MRVALFARYSSKLQDELSLDAQLAEMERFAAARGDEVVARYLLPETKSSDIERTQEFQQMLADAKAKRFDVLLCHKLDRLGRDRDMAVLTKAHLRRLGIEIRSVVENLGDSIQDRMMEGMLELFNDFYRSNLGEETKKGHRQLVRQGYWRGGKVPWGLALEDVAGAPAGKRARKRLVADSLRGPVMRELFERLAAGATTGELLDLVEARTGERWQLPSFYTRVRNPIYYGLLEYGKTSMPTGRKRKKLEADDVTEGRWEGLVSEEVWRAAQTVVAERGRAFKKDGHPVADQPYTLSGAIECLKCGAPITGSRHAGTRRYVCSKRTRGCTHDSIDANGLEPHVIGQLAEQLGALDLDAVLDVYQASLEPEREASEKLEAKLRRDLTEVRRKVANLTHALAEGDVPAKSVGEALRRLEVEEGELADQIGRCQVESTQALAVNVALVRSYLEQVRTRIHEANEDDLNILFKHLFQLKIDLKTGEGQLFVKLAPQESVTDFVYEYGRSARI